MLVDTASDALNSSQFLRSDDDQSMSNSEDLISSDDESQGSDEVNDSMTLNQYQEGLCKETLIRKGSQSLSSAHKKGRVDSEDVGI